MSLGERGDRHGARRGRLLVVRIDRDDGLVHEPRHTADRDGVARLQDPAARRRGGVVRAAAARLPHRAESRDPRDGDGVRPGCRGPARPDCNRCVDAPRGHARTGQRDSAPSNRHGRARSGAWHGTCTSTGSPLRVEGARRSGCTRASAPPCRRAGEGGAQGGGGTGSCSSRCKAARRARRAAGRGTAPSGAAQVGRRSAAGARVHDDVQRHLHPGRRILPAGLLRRCGHRRRRTHLHLHGRQRAPPLGVTALSCRTRARSGGCGPGRS